MSNVQKSLSDQALAPVAEAILHAWHRAHGTESGSAHVMRGPQSVAIYIEDALCLAEQNLGQEPNNPDLVKKYVLELMHQVCVEQVGGVETAVNQSVTSTEVSVDPAAGWVMFFFKFGGPA